MASRAIVVDDVIKIKDYLSDKSESIIKYIDDNIENDFRLIVKHITHSDLTNSGKRNGMDEGLDRNYLYYLTTEEMINIEQTREKPFESAKQSNIFVPSEFYSFLEMPELERRVGAQTTQHEHPIVNNYADVMLVNDTLKYFDIEYTKKVLDKLGKNVTWNFDELKIDLSSDDFTPIQLTHAIHGVGTSSDIEFHKLRKSIFKSDSLMILLSKDINNKKNSVFIMLEKNPKFFTIIGEGNQSFEKYLENNNKQAIFDLLKKESLSSTESDKTRKYQNKWRNMLAEEMMSYTTSDDEVFCPLTYISAHFSNVGTLFRASHIKGYKECNMDEAFDINNGILMVANADALFDKHLITIDDDGKIIYSYLIENEGPKFKHELMLSEKVFYSILNEKRREYLKRHREVFQEKEIQRRLMSSSLDDSSDEEIL